MMKAMRAQGVEQGEDYRHAAGVALKIILVNQMSELVDCHLDDMAEWEFADRRNASYTRWLMTELDAIELAVPRTRPIAADRHFTAGGRGERYPIQIRAWPELHRSRQCRFPPG